MPLSKNAFARYQIIDACLRNKQKRYPDIGFLLEKCQERLDRSISRSTIEKDLRAMRDLPEPGYNAPIAFDRINNGYYYTNPDYSIYNIIVKDEDIDAIEMAATMLSKYREFHVVKRYAEAIDRILDVVNVRRILSKDEFEQYVQLEKPVYVRGTDFIEPVIRAIQEKIVLKIEYKTFYREISETRIVHPYLLKEYHDRWYVVGLDERENDLRTFGLDRIQSIDVEKDKKFKQVKFSPKDYFRNTIGINSPQGKPPLIKIEVTRQQAQYLLTQPVHHSQKVIKETKGKVIFSFEVHPTYEFIAYILGFRDQMKVLAPNCFRNEIKDILGLMLKKYGST